MEQAQYSAALDEALALGLSYNEIGYYQSIASTQGYPAAIAALNSYIAGARQAAIAQAQFEEEERKRKAAEIALAQQWLDNNAKKTQAEMEQVQKDNAARAAAAAAAAAAAEKNKPWWEKAIDWVDQNQVVVAIGVGIVLGVAATLVTGGLAAPLLIGAVAAAATTGLGTVALNSYYDRPLDQNLIRNMGLAATGAIVTVIAPTFLAAGQSVVAAAVPYLAAGAGVPIAIAQALGAVVAPIIGFGASVLALGSIAVGGAGMAYSSDPTLSAADRKMGEDLEMAGLVGLGTSTAIFDAAGAVNGSITKGSEQSEESDATIYGSTGRSIPNDLSEKLGMEQAQSDPSAGKILPIEMNDPRWPAAEGWVKMQQIINGIKIHYVYNTITHAAADFKFVK